MKKITIIISLLLLTLWLYGCTVKEIPPPKINETIAPEIPSAKIIPSPNNITINFCQEFCYFVRGGEHNKLEYNESNEKFFCQCFDYSKELLVSKEVTTRDLELYQKKKVQWEKMPLAYQILNKDDCGAYETRKIGRALARIQEATNNVVQFQEVEEDANLEFRCKFIKDCYKKKIDIRREEGVIYEYESICPHEAGIAKITDYQGFTIKKATIDIIGLAGFAETSGHGASGFYVGSCGHPAVEIHEILHTFGFGHTNNSESIMYHQAELVPYTILQEGACTGSEKKIDLEIIDDLLFIYGE